MSTLTVGEYVELTELYGATGPIAAEHRRAA
jgi:hypothetical protein